ncbi:MAG: FAD-dependent oxidoreductase [Synergistaceae bacterium]|nr:FAD-dependent oxidoreductase [Synergistaceae bacterium]
MTQKIKSFCSLFLIFVLCFCFVGLNSSEVLAKDNKSDYDVVVVGAGLSGVSAAISAARRGMRVLVVEDTEVVGGQAVASAVSTMDDMRATRHGIYVEFLNKATNYYRNSQTPVNICLWSNTSFAFEPKIIDKILREMMAETGKITLVNGARVLSAEVKDNTVTSINIIQGGKQTSVAAKIFIDATECGDFIPLTGARYRVGNGIFPSISEDSIIQDITYVAVLKKYGDDMPKELFLETKPPHYDEYVSEFRDMVVKEDDLSLGTIPLSVETLVAYRALPNEEDLDRSKVDGWDSSTWKYISRTYLNWANDWPGEKKGGHVTDTNKEALSLSAKFLTDIVYRKKESRAALIKTLCFIYYMQHELGLENWAIDTTQNFGKNVACDLENWSDLPPEFLPTVRFFPPKPYVRESKRIIGCYTMSSKDVRRDDELKRTLSSNREAIALGEYPTDIHGKWNPSHHEADLLDAPEDFVKPIVWEARLFQVPMGSLIPEKIDGLLAAEKNIAVSRFVNGAIRLHPIVFHTGEAAGVLASMAIKLNVPARRVPTIFVQSKLLESWSNISIWRLKDVWAAKPYYKEISIALIYNMMNPVTERRFYPEAPVSWQEFCDTIASVLNIKFDINLTEEETNSVVSKQEANRFLLEESSTHTILKAVRSLPDTEKPLQRQDLACFIYDLLLAQAEKSSGLTYPRKKLPLLLPLSK